MYVLSMFGISDQLNPCSRVVPEKPKKKSLSLHGSRGLPYATAKTTDQVTLIQLTPSSYPISQDSLWHYPPVYTYTFHVTSALQLSQSKFHIHLYYSPVSLTHATCPTNTLFKSLIAPGTESQLWSSKLCNFLQYLSTSSLACSNIHCSAWFLTTFALVLHNWYNTLRLLVPGLYSLRRTIYFCHHSQDPSSLPSSMNQAPFHKGTAAIAWSQQLISICWIYKCIKLSPPYSSKAQYLKRRSPSPHGPTHLPVVSCSLLHHWMRWALELQAPSY
jgi:hypothetical protein